jgi:UDP-N-acetylglucosamine 4,6-dehydratase/5-epimerase
MQLEGKVLITGGAGFLGRAFMRRAFEESWDCTFTVFSRDEQKQAQVAKMFGEQVHCVLGDVRDTERLRLLAHGHELVIHAGALKHIPEAEYNVAECINVNIGGSAAVIHACRGIVETVVAISTDKAVEPLNIYGATKMAMERLFIEADRESQDTAYRVVRYGNVVGSTGSVIPRFAQQAEEGCIKLTDERMTRFWLSPDQAVDIVLHGAMLSPGQCVVIPEASAMSLIDLVDALYPEVRTVVTGIRPGEKLHESLLSAYEAPKALNSDDGYVYYSPLTEGWDNGLKPMTSDKAPKMSAADMVEAVERAQTI